jgi:ferredoxin
VGGGLTLSSRVPAPSRYGPLEMILALPEHHYDLRDEMRCVVCGRLKGRPKGGLVRHLFCLSDRKNKSPEALVVPGAAMAGFCGLRLCPEKAATGESEF